MTITIRHENVKDVAEIDLVVEKAFLNAPHSDANEHFIVRALRDEKALTISMVAQSKSSIIGHIAISPISISDGTKNWYGLGPISVLPEYQKIGVGSKLMHEALSALKKQGASGCVVLGEPAYYQRFGFKANPSLLLEGVPPQYFQILVFDNVIPTGLVSYHQAFSAAS